MTRRKKSVTLKKRGELPFMFVPAVAQSLAFLEVRAFRPSDETPRGLFAVLTRPNLPRPAPDKPAFVGVAGIAEFPEP
jgi:hypothetical protein